MEIKDVISAQKKHEKSLFKKTNVVSVGCGYRFKNGKQTSEIGLIVGVSKKLPVASLFSQDVIPSVLDGVPVDVHETGLIQSHQEIDPTKKNRPAMPGTSIGHKSITSGTFGCVVKKSGIKLILSNNHVLANSNDARIGDDIYQPGAFDGGTSADKIGTLFDFVPMIFDGSEGKSPNPTCSIAKGVAGAANLVAKVFGRQHRLIAFNTDLFATTNKVDCAVAIPLDENEIVEDIVQIGKPIGISEGTLGLDIQKFGRTTSYTTGSILQVNVTVKVSYGTGKVVTFVGQLISGAMSAGGDSGSACLNMQNELVGLLYAGSDATTIFNRIQDVFEALSITL